MTLASGLLSVVDRPHHWTRKDRSNRPGFTWSREPVGFGWTTWFCNPRMIYFLLKIFCRSPPGLALCLPPFSRRHWDSRGNRSAMAASTLTAVWYHDHPSQMPPATKAVHAAQFDTHLPSPPLVLRNHATSVTFTHLRAIGHHYFSSLVPQTLVATVLHFSIS